MVMMARRSCRVDTISALRFAGLSLPVDWTPGRLQRFLVHPATALNEAVSSDGQEKFVTNATSPAEGRTAIANLNKS
jgi:hypothetical protein